MPQESASAVALAFRGLANQWLERTSLRRHGSYECGWQQPRRLRSPLSHTVRLVGKEVKTLKKVYKGIVEGDVIRLEKQIGLPVGTQILVTLKTLYKDEQKKIKDRQIKLLDRGFYLGKKLYSRREDLYAR